MIFKFSFVMELIVGEGILATQILTASPGVFPPLCFFFPLQKMDKAINLHILSQYLLLSIEDFNLVLSKINYLYANRRCKCSFIVYTENMADFEFF